MVTLVIYHAGCNDGFCAAWLLHRAYPDAEYVPCHYGDPPPNVEGKHVVIADFSFKRDVLLKMKEQAASLLVLDHHKTAEADLTDLPFCVFDMNKSGGRLAYEWLTKGRQHLTSPWLVDYTEDRDLWRHALQYTHEVNAALRSFPLDFSVWDSLHRRSVEEMAAIGARVLAYSANMVRPVVDGAHEVTIDGHVALITNATFLVSEVCQELAKKSPSKIGMSYFDTKDKRIFNLRSTNDGPDVSEIAKRRGGGGHAHAAGFTAPLQSVSF